MLKFNPNRINNKTFILANKGALNPTGFNKEDLCKWFEDFLLSEKLNEDDLINHHQRHIKMLEDNILWNYGSVENPEYIGYYVLKNERTEKYFEEDDNQNLKHFFVLIELNSKWSFTVPICDSLNRDIELNLGLEEEDFLNETEAFFSYADSYWRRIIEEKETTEH